jgi:hypothetical protein
MDSGYFEDWKVREAQLRHQYRNPEGILAFITSSFIIFYFIILRGGIFIFSLGPLKLLLSFYILLGLFFAAFWLNQRLFVWLLRHRHLNYGYAVWNLDIDVLTRKLTFLSTILLTSSLLLALNSDSIPSLLALIFDMLVSILMLFFAYTWFILLNYAHLKIEKSFFQKYLNSNSRLIKKSMFFLLKLSRGPTLFLLLPLFLTIFLFLLLLDLMAWMQTKEGAFMKGLFLSEVRYRFFLIYLNYKYLLKFFSSL